MRGRGGGHHGPATGGQPTTSRGVDARGRAGGSARGASRGGRGASNGNSPGTGSASATAARGGKRKAGTDFQSGNSKRRNTDSWGSQPIPQQPLKSESYGAISYDGNDAEWYQDSYGQNWG